MKKIMVIFGTRPEAIKMCPLVLELKKREESSVLICLTGQHKEMLQQVMDAFGLKEDYNLQIMRDRQTLTSITSDILIGLEEVIKNVNPDIVLVHGDTTTAFVAALAAFYQKVPVGHVEAGLRTGNIYSPYPEEMNRLLISKIATCHFAPTIQNKRNLEHEGIVDNVYVTGNTVIDAFKSTVKANYRYHNNELNSIDFDNNKVILVTAHRRENWGRPLENICRALAKIADLYADVKIIYPVHLNPLVRNVVYPILREIKNVILLDPIDVLDMHNLMSNCYFVMTDSGGIQEEAPAFGKPVLVLRTETERPEAVQAGTVKVVGVKEEIIFNEAKQLLENAEDYMKMAHAINPYGDGLASKRIADIIMSCKYKDGLR